MGNKLVSPTTFQGGKQRIASKIIDIINPSKDKIFYDLCCGSGAISLELINRGYNNVVMLDISPWGLFWKAISEKTFDLDKFAHYCNNVPENKNEIQVYLKNMSKTSIEEDTVYKFLLLQAGSFGGKAISNKNWSTNLLSFRNYWQPTETSNRRSPVNPMKGQPKTFDVKTEVPTV